MNIKELRSKTGLSQKEFGARLGLTSQSITKFEAGGTLTDTVKKLIGYEFAEFLPENEQSVTVHSKGLSSKGEEIQQLQRENEELKGALKDTEHLKEHNVLLKRTIELLEDQVKMYKNILGEEDKSKTA